MKSLNSTSAVSVPQETNDARDGRPYSKHVTVHAANPEKSYKNPDICNMNAEELERIQFGYLAHVQVSTPGSEPQELLPNKLALPALCAMSPIIKGAVNANGDHQAVDYIALPRGNTEAYKILFAWLDKAILSGEVLILDRIEEIPLSTYYEIVEITKKLAIQDIVFDAGHLYQKMITWTKSAKWHVRTDNVKWIYENCKAGHQLRKDLVNNIAKAWRKGDLTGKNGKAVLALTLEIDEFWNDMEGKWPEVTDSQ